MRFSWQAGASWARHSTVDKRQGAAPPTPNRVEAAAPRHRRIEPSVLDADLDVTPERNRCTTDRRERYGWVVTLQQTMNHSATRAHATRELTLRHLLLLHGPMQFRSELSLDSECGRLFGRSVILQCFVRVALRATSRLLPSHMYFGLCRVRVRQPVNFKAGRL